MNDATSHLVACEHVTKTYRRTAGAPPAVADVTLNVAAGEVVGVVGESGSGKTTLARLICGLLPFDSGSVTFQGQDLTAVPRSALWRDVQLVPQDSYGSLNPALTAQDIVAEPIHYYGAASWKRAREDALSILAKVGVSEAMAHRHPPTLSGGQRQRVALARAISVDPRLLICDESTSALDVSVQAQILNLIEQLQGERHFAVLFVSHDIEVVRYLARRVIVMQHGKIVEVVQRDAFEEDLVTHPYTRQLLAAVPTLDDAA